MMYFLLPVSYTRLINIFVTWPPLTSNSIMAEKKYEIKKGRQSQTQ